MYPITLDGESVAKKREEIKNYFLDTFALFEKIFELLGDESVFYKQSEPTRHPMIFYFGHTATFFINKLILMKIIKKRINPEFESIFAVGVDEMVWDDMGEQRYNWPRVDEVRQYRSKVKELVLQLIDTLEFTLPIEDDSPMWIILMAIEHERIHIETSLVLHCQMPLQYTKEVEEFIACSEDNEVVKNELVAISARDIELGKTKESNLYGWDNEYGSYKEHVSSFEVAKYLVSNGEYLSFVQDNGYEREEFWDEEGWQFVQRTGAKHPPFWVDDGGTFRYRTLSSIVEMPQSWPVEVNALEAAAFCRYKSQKDGIVYQLPSEGEYKAMLDCSELQEVPALAAKDANVNFEHYCSSMPVNSFSFQLENGKEIYDLIGNVWQWSRTPIRAYDGFEVHAAYDDFSVPTFDEKHALILGSSWASSGNLMTLSSRYAFRRHFYQFAGFRYVVTTEKKSQTDMSYESDALVSQYCNFQYGATHFGVKNFALACVAIANRYTNHTTKALDLGCATGRASFELAKTFDMVEGVDFSARFIQVGVKLQQVGYVAFESVVEGDITQKQSVTIEELGYADVAEKVQFWQGDACNLKPQLGGYDLILATNLLDRLYNPKQFLGDMAWRLNKDGVLVLTSPYTWQEASTNKELWLGGYYDENGEAVFTLDTIKKLLEKDFELLHVEDVEFVIQETARKFQHTNSQVSVWRKK